MYVNSILGKWLAVEMQVLDKWSDMLPSRKMVIDNNLFYKKK